MQIKIANLSDGEHFFDFDESVSKIGLEAPFEGNFKARVKLTKSHSQIILNTALDLLAGFECDRCTVDYKSTLSTTYQVVYLFSKEAVKGETDDLIYISHDADVINLSKELRDYALLAVPMKKLCFEGCLGLCQSCGKDLNTGDCNCSKTTIDPRWEPLEKIKSKSSNN